MQRDDELDQRKKERFPEVIRTHKESRRRIADQRKKLLAEDPIYKEMLVAIYRAERAMTAWLIEQHPESGNLPESQRKREIERLRRRYRQAAEYLELAAARDAAERKLKAAYPELFVTDDDLKGHRAKQREVVENDPEFKELTKQRAAAHRAQQAYLFANDSRLADLLRQQKGGNDGGRASRENKDRRIRRSDSR